jgi:heme-degrading monooxygenase HmoA
VISVWDSEDQFHRFRDEKLIPALREVGGEERIAPSISADEVYNFITD